MIARRVGPLLRLLQQLVAARVVERIIHRGSAAGTQFADPVGQLFGVIGEFLRHLRSGIESHDKGAVVTLTHGLVQKLDCRFLLELEAVAHRTAGIDQQAHLQRQIRLGVEAANLRHRLVVVHDAKVALLQIGHALAVLVGHSEDDVHFVGADDGFWEHLRGSQAA